MEFHSTRERRPYQPPADENDIANDDASAAPSVRSGSAASLAHRGAQPGTAGAGGAAAREHEHDDHYYPGEDDSSYASDDDDNMAGMPIGMLAAMKTPYAKKPLFRSKKFWLICIFFMPIVLVIAVVIAIFPVLRAVANHTVNVSVLHVYSSNITNPTANNFTLTLDGQAKKVGIFPAHLYFGEDVSVYWIDPADNSERRLGSFPLAYLGIAAGHGRIRQQSFFTMDDMEGFASFTKFLITQDEFTWRLKSNNIKAKAFGFLSVSGLGFDKHITLKGIGNLSDIAVTNFQIPGDDPAGGVTAVVQTRLRNPSPFGVSLGTLALDLYYKGVYIGPVQSTGYTNLTSGENNFQLAGQIMQQTDPASLAIVGELLNQYVKGEVSYVEAQGKSATLPDGTVLPWLDAGIKALRLTVPLTSPTGPINPINAINVGSLNVTFDAADPYNPITTSNAIFGDIGLPFGFSLNISNVANEIAIVQNGSFIGNITSGVGQSAVVITSRTPAQTNGTLTLNLPPSPLRAGPSYSDRLLFSQFETDLTTGNESVFTFLGSTNATVDSPIGQTLLTQIPFAVPGRLGGLQGLKSTPPTINSVDVTGGTPDYLELNISVTLNNPSNIALKINSDTAFQLFVGDGNDFVGRAIIPALDLAVGSNQIQTLGQFQANANAAALQTINNFTSGLPSTVFIRGFNGSTDVESLTQALMQIDLKASLAGLTVPLVNSARVVILPSTGIENNIAQSIVRINNPFSTPLQINNIQANASSRGILLGQIGVATDFTSPPRQISESPALPFSLNLFPPDLFSLLRRLAVEAGLDPTLLDGIVQIAGYEYVPTTAPNTTTPAAANVKRSASDDSEPVDAAWSAFGADSYEDLLLSPVDRLRDPSLRLNDEEVQKMALRSEPAIKGLTERAGVISKRGIYSGFNLTSFVLTSFSKLTVDAELITEVTIGQFRTALQLTQRNIPAVTDDTLLLLLPVLARPIVQRIVDQSILNIESVLISDPTATSFVTSLVGSVTNAGPFDGSIAFPNGLSVFWNAQEIGSINLPEIALVADVGASLNINNAPVQIGNVDTLAAFTRQLLQDPSFTWQIVGRNLSVTALGITIDGVDIQKSVVLAGFNGLRDGVNIIDFDLPANAPEGGVALNLRASITNPSAVGVNLNQVGFNNFFGSTLVGPVGSTNFLLAPKSSSELQLSGRLIPQTTQQGLDDISTLINAFLHGVPSNLVVQGAYGGPPEATWLNDGIKALNVPAILPAAVDLEVIRSISLNSLSLVFTPETAWRPLFSSNDAIAAFQLPFAFPIDLATLASDIYTADNGVDFARLSIPDGPVSTDVVARTTRLTFDNVPFEVLSDAHPTFSQFLTDATVGDSKTFELRGTADSVAITAIGRLNVQDVTFSVSTTIGGLEGLNARPASVSDLDVFRGYPSYLEIRANAQIYNPSNISITVIGNTAFGVIFNGQQIGTANINNLVIAPGTNVLPASVHYEPQGSAALAAGTLLLENYIQRVPSDTVIQGTDGTTDVASLVQAFKAIGLATTIPPLEQNLVISASITIPPEVGENSIGIAQFTLANPFTASISIESINATASFQGINIGFVDIDRLSPPIFAPGHTQVTSAGLPIRINTDPKVLVAFIQAAAKAQGVNLGPLNELFDILQTLPSSESSVTTSTADGDSGCRSSGAFDVNGAILASLNGLRVDLYETATVSLDEYRTSLTFRQPGVPTAFDNTVLRLVGVVGAPLVQYLVDNSTITVKSGLIQNVTDNGFTAQLSAALTGTGPLDAFISFPEPVSVIYLGNKIAELELPDLCAAANVGIPDLQLSTYLRITDLRRFTSFTEDILHNESFEWTLTTARIRATALGIVFDNVLFSKKLQFQGFNNLPGVTIENLLLPGDAPQGGISIETSGNIPNPSNLGIVLGEAEFLTSYKGLTIGPVSSDNLTLPPSATTTVELNGRVLPQSSKKNLALLGEFISQFLAGTTTTLTVTGQSVTSPAQPDRPVNWLSAAFKTLELQIQVPGKRYDIIQDIKLYDLEVFIEEQDEAYRPIANNNYTLTQIKNPFGFSLTVLELSPSITLIYNGVDTAEIDLKNVKPLFTETSTGQTVPLAINFKNQPIQSLNTGAFNAFFAQVADTPNAPFNLSGTADVVARTAAGDVPVSGVPFNVASSIVGLNALGGTAPPVSTAPPPVIGSGGNDDPYGTSFGSDFIRISTPVIATNPSNVTIHTNFAQFDILYKGAKAGEAVLKDLVLYPGQNTLQAQSHIAPTNDVALGLVTEFLSNPGQIPVSIKGTQASSPYGSLKDALEGITLTTTITGNGPAALVKRIFIYLDVPLAACSGVVSTFVQIANPLDVPIVINTLRGQGSFQGTVYADIVHQFSPPLVIGAKETVTTDQIYNVKLTQGLVGSFPIITPINAGEGLDLTTTVDVDIERSGGYNLANLPYNQQNVSAKFTGPADSGLGGSVSGLSQQEAVAVQQLVQNSTCVGGIFVPPAVDPANLPDSFKRLMAEARSSLGIRTSSASSTADVSSNISSIPASTTESAAQATSTDAASSPAPETSAAAEPASPTSAAPATSAASPAAASPVSEAAPASVAAASAAPERRGMPLQHREEDAMDAIRGFLAERMEAQRPGWQ